MKWRCCLSQIRPGRYRSRFCIRRPTMFTLPSIALRTKKEVAFRKRRPLSVLLSNFQRGDPQNPMRISYLTILAALLLTGVVNNSNSHAQSIISSLPMPQAGPVEEHLPRKADTTAQRLDQMHLPSEPVSLAPPTEKPIRLNPNVSVSLALSPDGALQSTPGSAHPATIGLNKEGLGNGFPNFQV